MASTPHLPGNVSSSANIIPIFIKLVSEAQLPVGLSQIYLSLEVLSPSLVSFSFIRCAFCWDISILCVLILSNHKYICHYNRRGRIVNSLYFSYWGLLKWDSNISLNADSTKLVLQTPHSLYCILHIACTADSSKPEVETPHRLKWRLHIACTEDST